MPRTNHPVTISITAAALYCVTSTSANAQSAVTPMRVFECTLKEGGKHVSVTKVGASLVYSYGFPGRPEMRIIGSAEQENIHYYSTDSGRGAWEKPQLRFSNGLYSYIVYSRDPPEVDGAGLMVLKEKQKLSDKLCLAAPSLVLSPGDSAKLPQDSEDFSVIDLP